MADQERLNVDPEGTNPNQPSWINQAQQAAAAETRWQPWKKTMERDEVNKGFEGEDKIKTRSDDDVQHSTVAG